MVIFNYGINSQAQPLAGDAALMYKLRIGIDGPVIGQHWLPVIGKESRVWLNGHAAGNDRVIPDARNIQLVHCELDFCRAVIIQIAVQKHAIVGIAVRAEDGLDIDGLPDAASILHLRLLADHAVEVGSDYGIMLFIVFKVGKGQLLG